MEFFSYRGEKCALRPIKMEDINQSLLWRNDPEVRDNIQGYRYPITFEMEQAWLEGIVQNKNQHRVGFAVEDLTDGVLVGFVFLNDIDFINRHAKLGTVLGNREKWGKGFGTECSRLICEYGFKMLNIHRIWVEIISTNIPSIKMCERIGFVTEGELKQHFYNNGKYYDVTIMALINEK